MTDERLAVTIRGRVQMVGFRAFAQARAAQLGVTGYARNTADGAVEVVAEGPRQRLESLLADLRRGPAAARVEQVEHRWERPTGEFRSFRTGY